MRIRDKLFGLSLIFAFAVACAAQAHPAPGTFSFDLDREPVVSIDGQWRFHPGDDPRWSQPDFDDSAWPLIQTGKTWYEQGYPHLDGFAWYRATIRMPDQVPALSLLVPYVVTSYQVFANGQLLGGVGAIPPRTHPIGQFRVNAVYRIPTAAPGTHSIVLAFRVWHSPLWQDMIGGQIANGLRLGATPLILERKQQQRVKFLWSGAADFCLALIALLAACASLGFYLKHPAEKEYLWFMAAQSLYAVLTVLTASQREMVVDVMKFDLIVNVLSAAGSWAALCFFRRLLGGRRDWLFNLALGSVAAVLILMLLVVAPDLFFQSNWRMVSISQSIETTIVLNIVPSIWVLWLLFRRAVQGRFDARLLLTPVLLQQFALLVAALEWVFVFVVGHTPAFYVRFDSLCQWPFPISVPNLCDFLFLAGMLAIFVHRFLRTSRMEDAHQRELEAARTVQQVLIPDQVPAIPGFLVETVYRPAGVVGGDFFQILPVAGGALAIVGDVSGKGMPAAMMVSLLVGTIRTLAHYSHRPGEILTAMNQRMLGRTNGGFTTCLVLHAAADGTLTAANAGHLSPYVDGRELEIATGFPLGLGPADSYAETTLQLQPGQQLTLMTDGVVEARNASGELFGFARAAELSARPAESIAEAAQQFGQDDDITVVTLKHAGNLVHSPAPVQSSPLVSA